MKYVQHERKSQGRVPVVFRQEDNIRVVIQKYTQLSVENRHQIKALLDAGIIKAKLPKRRTPLDNLSRASEM